MDNKVRNGLFIGVILVVFVLIVSGILISGPGFFLNQTRQTLGQGSACTGGLVALSISKVERTPGDSKIRVYAVANGGAECLKIAWTKDQINQYLKQASPNEIADNGVYGDIVINAQSQTFRIQDTSNIVKNYFMSPGFDTFSCDLNSCKANGYTNAYSTTIAVQRESLLAGNKCHCIYTQDLGKLKIFSGGYDKDFLATFSIDGLGSTTVTKKKLSSDLGVSALAGSVNLGNKAFIQWTGDMSGSAGLGTGGNNPFMYSKAGNYILTTSDYSNLLRPIDMGSCSKVSVEDCIAGNLNKECYTLKFYEAPGYGTDLKCIDEYYKQIDYRLTNQLSSWVGVNAGIVRSADFVSDTYGAGLEADLVPKSTSYPTFIIDLDAAWVGIHEVIGKPKVTCPGTQSGQAGDRKNVYLQVSNVDATSYGAFGLSLTCDSPMYGDLSPVSVNLGPMVTQTINGYVTGGGTADVSKYCKFKAYAIKKPEVYDECQFLTDFKARGCNIEGQVTCLNNNLAVCVKGGWSTSICTNGCELTATGAQCRSTPVCNNNKVCETEKGETRENCSDCGGGLPECKSCTDWLFNKDKKCTPKKADRVFFNWIKVPFTDQKTVCPIYLSVMVLTFLSIGAILVLVTVKIIQIIRRRR